MEPHFSISLHLAKKRSGETWFHLCPWSRWCFLSKKN